MEDIKPKYSIIIPLYNKAPYICKALESVMVQTYRDWECIIVNDGSTDGSADVVLDFVRANDGRSRANALKEQLSLNDRKIRLITQANAGVAAARNRGVKESNGEYVAFLDADDWWKPTFLEEIDKLIRKYPDAGIYATNYVYYKPGKTHVALNLSRGYINYPEAYLKSGAMPVTSITTCMPRKVFNKMGGFPIGIKLGEDFLLWAKTALHYPIAFCEKPLAYYNNDIPASSRATRNLHAPEHHMLFNLQPIEDEINHLKSTSNKAKWMQLIDKLRIEGLMNYWLSDVYHDAAVNELEKVDWSKQPKVIVLQYEMPRWILKAKKHFIQYGSYIKQKMLK